MLHCYNALFPLSDACGRKSRTFGSTSAYCLVWAYSSSACSLSKVVLTALSVRFGNRRLR
jgi:hypothetical protein